MGEYYMLFFEAFEQLTCDNELRGLYKDAEVVKVVASKQSNTLTVHIKSKILLHWNHIKKMEELLNRQLFSHTGNKAYIAPCFELADKYELKDILSVYRNSILEELKDISVVTYYLLTQANVSIQGNTIIIKTKENCVAEEKFERLKDYLVKLFMDRFGYEITVKFEYIKPMEKRGQRLPAFLRTKEEDNLEDEEYEAPPYEYFDGRVYSDTNNTASYVSDIFADEVKENKRTVNRAVENKAVADAKAVADTSEYRTDADRAIVNGSTEKVHTTDNPAVNSVVENGATVKGAVNGNSNSKNGTDKGNIKRSTNGTGNGNNKSAYEKGKNQFRRLPKDPSVVYGKNFEGSLIPISDIIGEIGEVVIRGKVRKLESRPIGNEKSLITFVLTDFTDSIKVKIYSKTIEIDEILDSLKEGSFYMLKGIAMTDTYERDITIGSVVGIKTIEDFTSKRHDMAPQKRVELHAHTMMSDMDAVVDVEKLVRRAFEWGHPAVAITDHGVVQSFPVAAHVIEPKKIADPELKARAEKFKVIYGMEAYLVDDVKEVVSNGKGQSISDSSFVVFDIETTGFSKINDRIIEIGAVKVSKGEIIDRYSTFVNPKIPIPYNITQLTSISDDMVAGAPVIEDVLVEFLEFCKDSVLVAHNASFDMGFIIQNAKTLGFPHEFTYIDTVGLSRILLPNLSRYKLNSVAKALGVSLENHHRAVDDAEATAEIFIKLLAMLDGKNVEKVNDIDKLGRLSAEAIRKLPTYHAILLAKNDIGRINLYKMVSLSHIEYYNKRPKIPKSLLNECREGILVGSACEAGELYRAILSDQPQERIEELVNFYDYFEIQPIGNNEFLILSDSSDYKDINSVDDLKEINKKIVKLGETYHKPVVATCDVHFLEPEDEVYRRILQAGMKYKDADMQPPLYFRTTEEMLEEFAYLGKEKAEEVVITNTNLICDMIEKISPVRPDKCPPVLENSEENLRNICYEKAHALYGEELPEPVKARLEHELDSIISNGFAVMYIIAQKLVWKSNEDGYLVGSRGSVGSSFVATMAGITEVNPLAPHYYCSNCHYSDFDSEDVKRFAGSSGCDMPDKTCPVCGAVLNKDGHDIPFETFLGFNGDKEPDIDLNFSGEYQSKAHDYTEVIFGEGHTFRAGTIGTLADKTAYGFVKNYFEERGIHKRSVEIDRLIECLVGVRRTTGQHPGGIVVLPHGEDIYSFTPVQRPANDMESKTITTHFDYHSIDHNLLKLDILGHDDPTMIRMLEDITGLDARKIPFDEKKVLSLFHNTEALGISPKDIDGCELGCLGVPEFGTDFVMQMVKEAKPKTFSDLVRISGLSHGTDVWLNNAQTLIKDGTCTLSTCICTRDDIMTYLINMGVEPGLSFKIMESVRKGKGLTPEWEEAMLACNVPEWYIRSCKQIKYMFPKAHAAAYVMMAFRIAYFKIYYPLAYYAAFFSIRASAFNYELMCQGKDHLDSVMADYKRRMNTLSKKEQDTYKDMRIVQEMYARGITFEPIDIYKADAKKFQIVGDKIMPSLSSIDGMGEIAAKGVVEAAKKGKFLSRDDFKIRCKVSSTVVDTMARLGLLGDLPQSNQMSLLDFL
jgi:DNA polymerase-3 subunit alpha (Gram-positive type)